MTSRHSANEFRALSPILSAFCCGLVLSTTALPADVPPAAQLSLTKRVSIVLPDNSETSITAALAVGPDSLFVITEQGLYRQVGDDSPWRELLTVAPAREQIPFDECRATKLNRLILPGGIWRLDGPASSELLVLEHFCSSLYRLIDDGHGACYLEAVERASDADWIDHINVQNDVILAGLYRQGDQPTVSMQKRSGRSYQRLFPCPAPLARKLDSVGLDHTRFGFPALNPIDSSIWLAIEGYNYLFVLTKRGVLCDSIALGFDDYRCPIPPKSRIRSDAVWNEWSSHWTYVARFSYSPPGYFIMQYFVRPGNDTLPAQLSTRVWNTQKQVVELDVNPYWRIVGVQSDGRILFATQESDSTGSRSMIYVTRIEP